jgi:hypothetical protein
MNGFGPSETQNPASARPFDEIVPEILQLVPAAGWWIDIPSIDEATGAIMTNRIRAIAFATVRYPTGIEVRPIDNLGRIADCQNLSHEADAGLISKYKKRARAATEAGGTSSPTPTEMEDDAVEQAKNAKPDEHQVKHLKTALYEGLQWVSAILDKDPGDELLRTCRQQLRWMQSAVDNSRRPTLSELGQLSLVAKVVPELQGDDPYLAAMLAEIENLYRDL